MKRTICFLTLCLSLATAGNLLDFAGEVRVRTTTTLNSKTIKAGDAWDGSLAADVVRDGNVVLRRGTPVEGTVAEAQSKATAGQGRLVLKLVSINGQIVKSDAYERTAEVTHKPASKTMTGWAVTGALVGGLLHGGKGAAIGAGAGAGVGAMRSAAAERHDAVIPAETVLNFQLR